MTSELQREIKQTKPFRSLREEALLSVVRTAAVVREQLDDLLQSHGISSPQYNALRILRGAGDQGLSRNDIRDRMLARMPDVTRLLDRLEVMGLVRRERNTGDRRVVTTTITAAGSDLLAQLDAPTVALQQYQLRHFTDDQLRTLIDLLALARRTDDTGDADTRER